MTGRNYDLSRDSKRFLMLKPAPARIAGLVRFVSRIGGLTARSLARRLASSLAVIAPTTE